MSSLNLISTSPARLNATSAEHYIIRVTMEVDSTETDGNFKNFDAIELLRRDEETYSCDVQKESHLRHNHKKLILFQH